MVKKANEIGFDISFDEVLEEVSSADDGSVSTTDIISRPHLARVLLKRGFVNSFEEGFDKYLADGKPLHVNRFSPSFDEWIEMVHAHRGLVTWAHPLHGHKGSFTSIKKVAKSLVNHIDGIEINYRYDGKYVVSEDLQLEGTKYLESLIDRYNLLRTAGGDFHGNVGVLGGVDLSERDWIRFKVKLFSN